jgi:hypothetical protein
MKMSCQRLQQLASVAAIIGMAASFVLLAPFGIPSRERLWSDIPAVLLAALAIGFLLFARSGQNLLARVLCSTLLVVGLLVFLLGAWCTAEDFVRPIKIERQTFEPTNPAYRR